MEVHTSQTLRFERPGHGILRLLMTIEQEEATAACARDLSTRSSLFQGEAIALIDEVARETGRQLPLLLPGIMQQARELIQISLFQASLHLNCHLFDSMQGFENRFILVLRRLTLVSQN